MNRIYLRRVQQGFIPDTAEDWEKAKRYKLGAVVKAEVTNPRNLAFFRKWWALVTVGFDLWEELCPRLQYKGQDVAPNIERFRKDLIILCGYSTPTLNIKGELRMEADSIAFGNMSEEDFDGLYQKTIDVLLHKVLRGNVSAERLRDMVDSIMEFAS
jgi:hypothetical protein